MKNHLQHLVVAFLCLGIVAVGCSDNPSGVQPVDLAVSVTFDANFGNLPASAADITMTNVTSQQVFEGQTDNQGAATFMELPSGNYDIQVILTLTRNQVFDITGVIPDNDEVVFNASLSNVLINADTQIPVIELTSGRLGDLVFKQIYFAGSDRTEGALFRDQFIEIYNNSNEVVYLDGLYIMGVFGNANSNRTEFVTEDKQFDWNQSLGMPGDIDANADYLHAKWMYQIPGQGEEWPLEPGESVVIAQTALNHAAPYTNANGDVVTVGDPSLTVDLSDADFEVYLGDEFETTFASDIDNPNVPNLRNIFIFGRDLILDNLGRDGFVIFRADIDASEFQAYPSPITREIRDNTTFYPQIPIEWVIDAVETQPSPANQVPRKLQNSLDAGYAYVPGGGYSSNSVIRLEAQNFNGRVVLKDTNNSTEDFTFLERANPRVDAPQAPNRARYTIRSNRNIDTSHLDNIESRWAPSMNRN